MFCLCIKIHDIGACGLDFDFLKDWIMSGSAGFFSLCKE